MTITSIGAWALAPLREHLEAQLDKIAGFTDPPGPTFGPPNPTVEEWLEMLKHRGGDTAALASVIERIIRVVL